MSSRRGAPRPGQRRDAGWQSASRCRSCTSGTGLGPSHCFMVAEFRRWSGPTSKRSINSGAEAMALPRCPRASPTGGWPCGGRYMQITPKCRHEHPAGRARRQRGGIRQAPCRRAVADGPWGPSQRVRVHSSPAGVVSVCTRKWVQPLDTESARAVVNAYGPWPVHSPTAADRWPPSIACGRAAMLSGLWIGGVRIATPFADLS